MEKISKLWFDDNRIWIRSTNDKEYSRPLEAFPFLRLSAPLARENYQLLAGGIYAYWPEADEYIEITSFFETKEPDTNNSVAAVFDKFPELNPKAVAKEMGIHYTLIYSMIYGMYKPTDAFLTNLYSTLRNIGHRLVDYKA